MKNKKGFTLVELLAVIVVLGIILSITTVSILNLKEKQDEENIKNTISSILTAAKEYNVSVKRFDIGEDYGIEVKTLKDNGYVDFDEEAKYKDKTYKEIFIDSDAVVYKEDTDCSQLKIKYVFSEAIEIKKEADPGYEKVKFNDCGCELNQGVNVTEQSEKLCYE